MTTTQERKEATKQNANKARLGRMARNMDTNMEVLPDYEKAQIEARRLLFDLAITAEARGGYKDETADGWKHRAFSVAFNRNSVTAAFDWKQGMAIMTIPDGAEVLASVCRDYLEASETSFEDWSVSFGYDTDSRKAFAVYQECLSLGDRIKKLGLSRPAVKALADLANRF